VTDEETSLGERSLPPCNFGDADQLLYGVSKSSVIGIAICDSTLRFLNINDAFAAMHGIPAEAHIGRTVREIIGHAALTVEPLLNSVLITGQSVLNLEIVAELPARSEQGHWIVNYLPVKDSTGKVKQIGVFVFEITRLRKFEQCLLALMGNLPRIRDQVICTGLPDRTDKDRVESLNGSIQMLQSCVREMRKVSQFLQPPSVLSSLPDLVTQQQISPPYGAPTLHKEPLSQEPGSTPVGNNGAKPLSPRETEIVQLLAKGNGNKEISTALKISVKTVETHRARILLKLQIHSISDLVLYAVRHGLVKA
jgi:DNA-binding CsgD family transcriptional regulator